MSQLQSSKKYSWHISQWQKGGIPSYSIWLEQAAFSSWRKTFQVTCPPLARWHHLQGTRSNYCKGSFCLGTVYAFFVRKWAKAPFWCTTFLSGTARWVFAPTLLTSLSRWDKLQPRPSRRCRHRPIHRPHFSRWVCEESVESQYEWDEMRWMSVQGCVWGWTGRGWIGRLPATAFYLLHCSPRIHGASTGHLQPCPLSLAQRDSLALISFWTEMLQPWLQRLFNKWSAFLCKGNLVQSTKCATKIITLRSNYFVKKKEEKITGERSKGDKSSFSLAPTRHV